MSAENCMAQVRAASPRPLSDDELIDIFQAAGREYRRMLKARRGGKGLNPTKDAMPPEVTDATVRAMVQRMAQQMLRAKGLQKERLALQIIRRAENARHIEAHPEGPARGVLSLLVKDKHDKGRTLSVEDRARGISRNAFSELVDIIEQHAPKLFGLVNDKARVRALVREMFGESTGDADAKAGAAAWRQVSEGLRERMNLAGGDVGYLQDWAIPQSHSPELVRAVDADAWVAEVMQLIDRDKYVNVDGGLMTTAQVKELLYAAHSTIGSGGLNKIEPGQFIPQGVVANRYRDHRIIHFKDADAWMTYHGRYAEKSVLGIMADRVEHMARDIALVEVLGPNARNEMQFWRDHLERSGVTGYDLRFIENVFAQLTGEANRVEWQGLARQMQNLRNLQTAAKLGGAALSSVTDFASSLVTARFNRLPVMQHVRNMAQAFDPRSADDVRLAHRAGLGLDTLVGELNRWADESLGGGWSSKMASAVLRASGLQALTEANRRAFSVTMMSTLGHLKRTAWSALHEADRTRLESYGFTAQDWERLARVELENWGNGNDTMLTPASIKRLADGDLGGVTGPDAVRARNELVTKVLGMILSEESYAVVTPGVRERALMVGGLKRGTAAGEIARSFWLFKSFPVAVIAKHWMRGWGRPTAGGKAAYVASYFVASTVLGAMAVQMKDIAKGREPREMDTSAFWSAAFLQGGGAGIFGDYMLSDMSRFGRSVTESALGPIGSIGADVYDLTLGNVHQAARGEDTHAGAEAVRFIQANTPGMNLWYTRAAFEHLLFHQVQEYLSPGYLRRTKKRLREDTGQAFWWEPGALTP